MIRKSGIKWTAFSSVLGVAFQIVQLSILARVLVNEQLGVLAVVNVFIAILNMFKDFGLSSFVIHRQDLSSTDKDCLFWLMVFLGAFVSVVAAAFSPFFQSFYNMPQLDLLTYIGAFNLFLLSLTTLIQAEMTKSFQFSYLAKIDLLTKFISFVVTLSLLFMGGGVFSPIVGLTVSFVMRLLLLAYFSNASIIRPWHWDWLIVAPALKFGVTQISGQFINQLKMNVDVLILAKVVGASDTGIYSLAKELVVKPVRLISPIFNRFSLPVFSKHQLEREHQSSLYFSSVKIMFSLSFIIYFVLSVFSSELVYLLYGENYLTVVPILLMTLSIFSILRSVGSPLGALCQANGAPMLELKWNVLSLGIISLVMILFGRESIFNAAWAMVLAQLLVTLCSHQLFICKMIDISFIRFLSVWGLGSAFLLLFTIISISEIAPHYYTPLWAIGIFPLLFISASSIRFLLSAWNSIER